MWNHVNCNDSVTRHGYVCQLEAFPNVSTLSDMRDMLVQLIQISENVKEEQERTRLLIFSLENASFRNTDLLEEVEKNSGSSKKWVIGTLLLLLLTSSIVMFVTLFTSRFCKSVRFPATRFQKLQFSFANAQEDEDGVCRV